MDKHLNSPNIEKKTQVDSEENRAEARRKFLKTAGKFALYTPPALMLLMHPSVHAISKSGGGNRPDGPPPGFNHVPGSGNPGNRGGFNHVRGQALGDRGPGNPGNRGGFK
ncbi:hypothetical protein Nhal_1627 [Nitrosococcus halophilus Nc 4]|uniref:Uncharacterized protein n=1 Tax=Nitrosococcus halophilus (strain Nc4) TaxID=472759 RepID=D5C2A2_NITHN|nr:hypothetical protein [Nitrosococcus halophilus]ADE14761.1 hypothetical protein Nhal_1627 [Nitrosococcus halophilus Nc 4]